ncbi:AEC family transporter [Polymorphum gilvum]|uniref:Transporter, AEC family n=1 Tax=Polymorphum gilvum (strain LMG 25793 / CGMCC 1.9160 / SL003B-26A1) TaxID=991905 RepID=F2IVZ6_POLGS|nr:AEC family transporter [Polymorphum gilvum]ADZ70278.1 Transporter, AEC family [Polymorphum gilvum SL003B-26A1]
MLTTLDALLPVILVIAVGHLVARTGLITGEQWRGIERIAYYVLFPAIVVETVARADFMALPALSMGATLVSAILAMSVLVFALRPLLAAALGVGGPQFTSIYQGSVRWNTFIALALADKLIGTEGLALLAVAIVAMIPILNVLSVLVLSRYAGGTPPGPAKVLRDLATNPFILSTLAGIVLNVSGLPLPAFAWSTLEILGSAALPIGIVCVGAGLDLAALRRPGAALAIGTALRLLAMPVFGAGFAGLYGVEGPALTAVVIATAVPAASGSYLLARQMGGDARLMAEILTLQTLLATATIPLALVLMA